MTNSPQVTGSDNLGLVGSVNSANTQCLLHFVFTPLLHQLVLRLHHNQDLGPVMQGSVLTTKVA